MMIRILFFMLITYSSLSAAEITSKQMDKLLVLNIACEQDRQKKLAGRKKEIYDECINHFKKSKPVCTEEAEAYNGNRINGAPLFYELPSCVTAFEYKKSLKK